MKILLTGNAGFIGMHTALQLMNTNHEVITIDNLNKYYDPDLKVARLKEQGITGDVNQYNRYIEGKGNIRYKTLNLEDTENIEALFQEEQFDIVVNLAAQAGVRYSMENPNAYTSSNVTGFLNILEACRKNEVSHLIYASSSSVYGLNNTVPFKESDPTEHPVSLYASTKKVNEMMAHSYANIYGLPVTGLRFFTVYGPWGRPDMALFKFTKNILEDKPIDVYNNGELWRDFTYIDDIVDGILRVINLKPQARNFDAEVRLMPDQSPAPYQIFNIGRGKPVKLMDFIHTLEEVLGKKAHLNYLPMQPGDVYKTFASTVKLEEKTGYEPKTSLKEGVGKFVEWYKEYYSN